MFAPCIVRSSRAPLERKAIMSLTEEEVNQLFTVAVLAFRAVESIGAGAANSELPGKMPDLDSFLANGVDDRLWNMIDKVAMSSQKPPFFLTPLALDASPTSESESESNHGSRQ